MTDYIMTHLIEILGLIGSSLATAVWFVRRFGALETRVSALETDLPAEITRLEQNLSEIKQDLREIRDDIKSLLRASPR